jgi:plasmid stabilization system protein ParE
MTAVTWDDEAQCELNCSALYYAKRSEDGLGERFLAAVEAALVHARATPVLFRKFRGESRRVRVERFPYSVVYSYDGASESIHVLAIAHSSREPDYWRARQF